MIWKLWATVKCYYWHAEAPSASQPACIPGNSNSTEKKTIACANVIAAQRQHHELKECVQHEKRADWREREIEKSRKVEKQTANRKYRWNTKQMRWRNTLTTNVLKTSLLILILVWSCTVFCDDTFHWWLFGLIAKCVCSLYFSFEIAVYWTLKKCTYVKRFERHFVVCVFFAF